MLMTHWIANILWNFFFKYTVDYLKQRHYAVHHVLIKKPNQNKTKPGITGKNRNGILPYPRIYNNTRGHYLTVSLRWQHIWVRVYLATLRRWNYVFPIWKDSSQEQERLLPYWLQSNSYCVMRQTPGFIGNLNSYILEFFF